MSCGSCFISLHVRNCFLSENSFLLIANDTSRLHCVTLADTFQSPAKCDFSLLASELTCCVSFQEYTP